MILPVFPNGVLEPEWYANWPHLTFYIDTGPGSFWDWLASRYDNRLGIGPFALDLPTDGEPVRLSGPWRTDNKLNWTIDAGWWAPIPPEDAPAPIRGRAGLKQGVDAPAIAFTLVPVKRTPERTEVRTAWHPALDSHVKDLLAAVAAAYPEAAKQIEGSLARLGMPTDATKPAASADGRAAKSPCRCRLHAYTKQRLAEKYQTLGDKKEDRRPDQVEFADELGCGKRTLQRHMTDHLGIKWPPL